LHSSQGPLKTAVDIDEPIMRRPKLAIDLPSSQTLRLLGGGDEWRRYSAS